LQKGYLLGERVLRPARVIVGSGDDTEAVAPTDAVTVQDEVNDAASRSDQETIDASVADATESG
jgi:hypothetical protein